MPNRRALREQAEADQSAGSIRHDDRDAIDVLPMSMVALASSGLSKTRLIKNTHLESVLELFRDEGIGSGQVRIEEIHTAFNNVAMSDVTILQKLANLASFDIYNLRTELPRLDIEVVDPLGLKLSGAKCEQLNKYMVGFIRPLIVRIFGDENMEINSYGEMVELFSNPNPKKTLANLRLFARKLDIELYDVPRFLSEYAEIFMSISYYRNCLDDILPVLADFQYSVAQIQTHQQLKYDRSLVEGCERVRDVFRRLASQVAKRFQMFDNTAQSLWNDLNGEQIRKFGSVMEGTQSSLGAVLCALSVKMGAWTETFPDGRDGSPQKWADFITTDMRQGLERFSAPAE